MKLRSVLLLLVVSVALAFLAGAWVYHRTSSPATFSDRKILYYVDPMHPAYRADKPGLAPDCGMPLEPVYADGSTGGTVSHELPGSVQVTPEKMQSIGVVVGTAERSPGVHSLRVAGRVVPDELRVYRLTAAIDGWVQSIGKATTGGMVKKNEMLMSYYAPDFLAAVQAYIYALGSLDRTNAVNRAKVVPKTTQEMQLETNYSNIHNYKNTLRNLGMSEIQMDEIARTREPSENIRLVAPDNGLVLTRNVFAGLKFERGTEFFRIADLSKVWVLADTYGAEVDHIKAGTPVRVTVPGRGQSFAGRVASVPPIFDQTTRTLRVRVEVNNPAYILRPDMFVDCELPVSLPAMLSVPSEALIDSGLRKLVYVEKKPGLFVPREVETGQIFGGRVEIRSGLAEGERIALSGTFLLDSESRMKTVAAGITSSPQLDPVCGHYVDEAKSRSAGLVVEAGGMTSYFCSRECKQAFQKNPAAPVLPSTMQTGSPVMKQSSPSIKPVSALPKQPGVAAPAMKMSLTPAAAPAMERAAGHAHD